jgi:hypothetical protein
LELRGSGVDVVDIEPGGYRTGIWPGARRELRRRQRQSARPDLYDRALHHLDRAAPYLPDSGQVGRAIGDVLTAGSPPGHVRIGPGARTLRILDAVLPDRLWDTVTAGIVRTG